MELELAELFPKQSDLRLQAVRLLIYLEESGPKKQSELVEELGLEAYVMSRLLAKLELHRYVVRRREGTDKIVGLHSWPSLVVVSSSVIPVCMRSAFSCPRHLDFTYSW